MDILVKGTRRHRTWVGVTLFACFVAGVLWLERRAEAPDSAPAPSDAVTDAGTGPPVLARTDATGPGDLLMSHPTGSVLAPPADGDVRLNLHEATKDLPDPAASGPAASRPAR